MKRFLIIVILISYSIASFGVSLNYFYCCGKLKTISLTVNAVIKDCSAKSKKGCCDNKTVTLKLKTDQKGSEQVAVHLDAPVSPAIFHADNYTVLNIAANRGINPLYEKLPPDFLPSRQVLYCIFRI